MVSHYPFHQSVIKSLPLTLLLESVPHSTLQWADPLQEFCCPPLQWTLMQRINLFSAVFSTLCPNYLLRSDRLCLWYAWKYLLRSDISAFFLLKIFLWFYLVRVYVLFSFAAWMQLWMTQSPCPGFYAGPIKAACQNLNLLLPDGNCLIKKAPENFLRPFS